MVRFSFPQSKAYSVVPKEAFNRHFFIAVFTFGVLGLARGLDEGVISSQVLMPAFKRDYGVEPGSAAQSNITSMVQIGCVGGALIAFFTNDLLGRIRCCQVTCLLWIIGAIVWMTSPGRLGQLYAGRLITGFGVGGTVVCGPTYLAEITPKSMRGSLLGVGLFSGTVYLGTFLGYAANLSAQRNMSPHSRNQYLVPTSLNIIFGGLFFLCSFFCLESPRWLAKKHRVEDAFANMQKLRQLRPEHPYLRQEWETILDSIRAEEMSRGANWRWYNSLAALVGSRQNMYILCCTVGAQVWGQFSGAGSIAVYAPQLFQTVSGKPKTNEINPSTTLVLGAVKLVASLLSSLFFLDRFGRKAVAMTGIVLQTVSLFYIAIYLRICPSDSPQSEGKKHGGEAAIAFLYLTGIAWAMGINSIQYILGAEYFSVVTRSLGTMISMAVHFLCQFGSSRAVNPMIDAWQAWGLFLFWAMVSSVCFFLVWFFLPESAGFSLEDMQHLFDGPWYKIGWKHNRPFREPAVEDENRLPDSEDKEAATNEGFAALEDIKPSYGPVTTTTDHVPAGAVISRDEDDYIDVIQAVHGTSGAQHQARAPATPSYTNAPQVNLANEPAVDDKKLGDRASAEDVKS